MVTIETVYEKLVQLSDLCDREFKEIHRRLDNIESRLDRTDRRMAHQDSKLDAFIQDVIDMKRDLKNPI